MSGATRAFADVLRGYRVDAGLTQEELAEHAGLSARGISDLERGARVRPHRDTVRMLADALGLAGADRAALFEAARGRAPGDTAAAPAPRAANLPAPPTPLLGRDDDVRTIGRLLIRDDVRLNRRIRRVYSPPCQRGMPPCGEHPWSIATGAPRPAIPSYCRGYGLPEPPVRSVMSASSTLQKTRVSSHDRRPHPLRRRRPLRHRTARHVTDE